jgi:hypothetical protein
VYGVSVRLCVRVLSAVLVLVRVQGGCVRLSDVLAGFVSGPVSGGFYLRVVRLAVFVNAVRVRFVGFASGVRI